MGPRIGVLGAGQLGRMLALAGYPLGLRFLFLDPTPNAPASELAEQIVADYEDREALAQLSACDLITYEFESVPVEATESFGEAVPVYPPSGALRVAQDRLFEKQRFRALGIPTADFAAVHSRALLEREAERLGFPCVLKTRRFGYDGRGQVVLGSSAELDLAWEALGGAPLILEQFVRFDRELSVLGVRGRDGAIAFYPLVENLHRGGILRLSRAPAPNVRDELRHEAEAHCRSLMEDLDYVGVLALELFLRGQELFANEMAPRVHNSGHFSLEGARTSQFENHLRAVLGLPLGSTEVPEPCCMLNLIGAVPEPARVLGLAGTHLHLYGKSARPGRKLGHITLIGADREQLEERVAALQGLPGIG